MKYRFLSAVVLFAVGFVLVIGWQGLESVLPASAESADSDWFMLQRAYPGDDVDPQLVERGRRAIEEMAMKRSDAMAAPWQSVGPSNIGGRITALALHPTNANLIYAGAAAGGVWRSTDFGGTWSNIFNESYSIGSLALDPNNPNTIYVGTGEANPGGVTIYPGNGIWRSTDAGATWTNLGLQNVGAIGTIAMHPSNSNRIFLASLGLYRSRTQDRGIYRSTNGGTSWSRVHFVDDTTGAGDVMIDAVNPNRIVATFWPRYRTLAHSTINGATAGLWLSTNGGDTWSQVTNGFPANDVATGRASLAYAPSSPNIYFALVSNGTGVKGIYKSTDSGTSWARLAATFGGEGQVWYNNVIAVHPRNANIAYALMTSAYRTTNGGTNWSTTAGTVHVDFHAIAFSQADTNRMVLGSDGGVFTSTNVGTTWVKSLNLPISQFYAGTVDFSNPIRYYGGMQDNGTARTLTGAENNWTGIYGGDGFYVIVDPTNNNFVYAESQNGGLARSTNGGTSFSSATSGISGTDRKNWNTPIAISLLNTATLYTGTHRLYKSTNRMVNWTAISADLTRGNGGRIGTITTIDPSPTDSNVVYIGTDDGKVQVTTNGGTTWNDITGILPNRWVTRVTVDPDSANVCYVTLSGYLQYDFQAHIYRTSNYGQTWTPIGGNLPNIPLNDIIVDPAARPRLYAASDAAVLYSTNYGTTWHLLGTGLPSTPVLDLTLHSPTRKLVAHTHGRSNWILDVTTLTRVAEKTTAHPASFTLHQNYPNPFNPATNIRFELHQAGGVVLKVFDVLGRTVATIVDENLEAGEHVREFSAKNLSSGVYWYRLEVGGRGAARRMIVIR